MRAFARVGLLSALGLWCLSPEDAGAQTAAELLEQCRTAFEAEAGALRPRYAAAVTACAKADQSPGAWAILGRIHHDRNGDKFDCLRAEELWLKAGNGQQVDAMAMLGTFYLGIQCPDRKDEGLALRWYQRARDRQNGNGAYGLGYLYEVGGKGLAPDIVLALRHYADAAAWKAPWANVNLGRIYETGRQAPGAAADLAKARDHYRKAIQATERPPAPQLLGRAGSLMGFLYLNANDTGSAFRCFEWAAYRGDPPAQAHAAWMLTSGVAGVPTDREKAFTWIQIATLRLTLAERADVAKRAKKSFEELAADIEKALPAERRDAINRERERWRPSFDQGACS